METLLKSARHYYYLIFPWIWEILNWKKSLSVWFVILRLFVNTLAADNKYSRVKLHTLTQIQTPLPLKQRPSSRFFIAVLKCAWNLEHFEYKVEYLSLIIFRNYIFRKSWFVKRLKDLASEQHSVNNALTVCKHSWNQHGTTIILFFHEFGKYWIGKSLCQSDLLS